MCRSIKQLRQRDQVATDDEIEAAARQFVRKVSGFRVPSQRNHDAFEAAIAAIAGITHDLLDQVSPPAIKSAEVVIE